MSEEVAAAGAGESVGEAAPSAAEAVAAAGEAEAAAARAWSEGLDSDSVSFIETKGWDKAENPVGEMLKSYRNIERLRGVNAEQLVRLPDPDNAEQVAEYRARLGVPESPEGYELESGTVAGQEFSADIVAGLAHRIGATPQQAADLNASVVEFLEQSVAAQEEARTAALSAEKADLDKAWGDKREAHELAAKKGFDAIGWDADAISAVESALGYRGVMELGVKLGQLTSEPQRSSSDPTASSAPFGLTPESAREQINVKGAELMTKAAKGDKRAAQELRHLNKVAYGTA